MSALFANTGLTTIVVNAAVSPGSWTFNSNAQAYTIDGQTVTLSGTLLNASTVTQSIGNVITGGASVQQNGTGTLQLNGANTYTGTTTVNGGTLRLVGSITSNVTINSGTFNSSGTVTGSVTNSDIFIANGGTVTGGIINNTNGQVTATGGAALNGVIQNSGTFNVSGVVSSDNAFTNTTSGTLAIQFGGQYAVAGQITNNAITTIANNGVLNANGGFANTTTGTFTIIQGGQFTGALSNAGQVSNSGTINGTVTTTAGLLTNTATGVVNGNLVNNGGTVTNAGIWNGGATVTGTLTNLNGGTWNGSVNNSGTFNNDTGAVLVGALTQTAGVATNAGSINSLVTVNGGTLNNTGTLQNGLLQTGGATTNSGTILNGVNVTGGNFTTTGTVSGGLTNSAIVNASGAINGAINNNAGGTFTVTGTLTANSTFNNAGTTAIGANTLNGLTSFTNNNTTTIAGGTLAATTITNNSTFIVGAGTSTLQGNVNNTATITTSASTTQLVVTGTLNGTVTVNVNLATGIANSTPSGTAAVTAGTFNGTVFAINTGGTLASLNAPTLIAFGAGANTTTATGLPPANSGLVNVTYQTTPTTGSLVYTANPGGVSATLTSILSALSSIDASFHQSASALVASPQSQEPNKWTGGVWSRVSGGQSDVKSTGTASGITSASKTNTRFFGYQVGLDGGLLNVAGSGWNLHAGITAGEIEATTAELLGPSSTVKFDSVKFYGVYGVFTHGAFFADIGYRHSTYDARVTNAVANLIGAALKGRSDNLNGSMGYLIRLGQDNWFIEPSAGISFTRSTFDSLSGTDPNAIAYTLSFGTVNSTLGRAGLRVGTAIVFQDKYVLSPFVTGSIWHEFIDNARGLFTLTASGSAAGITTDRIGTFYQVGAGVSGQILNTGLLGFVRTDFRFGNKLDGWAIVGGGRYTFLPQQM